MLTYLLKTAGFRPPAWPVAPVLLLSSSLSLLLNVLTIRHACFAGWDIRALDTSLKHTVRCMLRMSWLASSQLHASLWLARSVTGPFGASAFGFLVCFSLAESAVIFLNDSCFVVRYFCNMHVLWLVVSRDSLRLVDCCCLLFRAFC